MSEQNDRRKFLMGAGLSAGGIAALISSKSFSQSCPPEAVGVTVPTLSDLRCGDFSAYNCIYVISHSDIGDGGGGYFYKDNVNSASDNNATIIEDGAATVNCWKRSNANNDAAVNIGWFGHSSDFGAAVQAATDAGFSEIYVPPGTYTQETPLPNVTLRLFTDTWDIYGTTLVTVKKTFNEPHITSSNPFTSLGISWSGEEIDSNVASPSAGLILHKKVSFCGEVIQQPGDGLHLTETSPGGSHNLNGSCITGGFSNNGGAGILIEDTRGLANSADIDLNIMSFPNIRCNSNMYGVVMKGGLFNNFGIVKCYKNTDTGFLFDCTRAVSSNNFEILYTEDNTVSNIFIAESEPNSFRDNTFNHIRGLDGTDLLFHQGNIYLHATKPYVSAVVDADQFNVSGDGSNYTVVFNEERSDRAQEYNPSTGIFTAKYTGRYKFEGSLLLTNLHTENHERGRVFLYTATRTYSLFDGNLNTMRSDKGAYLISFSVIAELSTSDNAYIRLIVEGGSNNVVTINGSPNNSQSFLNVTYYGP